MDVIFFGAMLVASIIFFYFGSWFENKTLVFAGYACLFLLGLFVWEGLSYQQLDSQNTTVSTNYSYSLRNATTYTYNATSLTGNQTTANLQLDNSTIARAVQQRYTAVAVGDYFRWTFGLIMSLIGIFGILTLAIFKTEQKWI